MDDIVATFPTNPPFHVNCTHLAEELIRRLNQDSCGIHHFYGKYFEEAEEVTIENLAKILKEIII